MVFGASFCWSVASRAYDPADQAEDARHGLRFGIETTPDVTCAHSHIPGSQSLIKYVADLCMQERLSLLSRRCPMTKVAVCECASLGVCAQIENLAVDADAFARFVARSIRAERRAIERDLSSLKRMPVAKVGMSYNW